MFKASLFIFDKEYPLLSYELGSYQPADHEGLPNCRVVLEKIHFSYQSVKDDSAFLNATISGETMVSGYIRVYKRDGFQKFIDYEFANAYVLSFRETFTSTGKKPMTTHITIGAGILKVASHKTQTYWNPNDPYEEGEEVTVIEEVEPKFLEYIFKNENGEEIALNDLKADQQATLIIYTENADGEEIDLNLKNNKIDYLYDGVVAEDDIIKNITITGDETSVALSIIKEEKKED